MENLVAVILYETALVAPPLAVALGLLALALPARARQTPESDILKRAA